MAVRVVWGLSATMATLVPTSAFSSVDLPVLGRPSMETNPDWNLLMNHRLGAREPHLLHAQIVAGQHLDADAFALHGFSGARHAAEPLAHQSPNRAGFHLVLQAEAVEEIGQPADIEVAGDDEAAMAVFLRVLVRLVLVADFTDYDLQQVLHGGEAGGVAVLVDHDHNLRVALLQFEHIADVHETGDVVDVVFVDRDTGVLLLDDKLPELIEGGIRRYSDHIGPRGHYFAHHGVAELPHRLDKLTVVLLDQPFLLTRGDQGLDVLGRRGWLLDAPVFIRQVDQRLKDPECSGERPGHCRQDFQPRN